MKIVGVILAAGRSRRMQPKNKLLLSISGRTVIDTTVANLVASQVDEIIVVIGNEHERIAQLLAPFKSSKLRIVYNENFHAGRAESIKCAIGSFGDSTDAALFMPADKPGVTTELMDQAIDEFKLSRPALLYVDTPTGRGHPVIFQRSLFDELRQLTGDTVGAGLIEKHADSTTVLTDDLEQIDIDTPQDYERFLQQLAEQVRIG